MDANFEKINLFSESFFVDFSHIAKSQLYRKKLWKIILKRPYFNSGVQNRNLNLSIEKSAFISDCESSSGK